MRHLVYLGNANCQPCRDYKERVIDPLIESYPDAIEVHARYDARFAQANALIPVTKVPTIIVEIVKAVPQIIAAYGISVRPVSVAPAIRAGG